MNLHRHYQTPLGPCILLTMSVGNSPWQERNWKTLRTIGMVLGGIFNKKDSKDEYEILDGLFAEEDGMAYHFKYAVLTKALGIKQHGDDSAYATLRCDTEGLSKSIEDWNAKFKKGGKE